MASILLKNGRIWNGEKFFHGDVLTKDGLVEKIGTIFAPAHFVFDAQGKIIAPGLVDAHIHIQGPEPDLYGINAEMCTIPFGVTAAADAGGARADQKIARAHLVKNVTFVSVAIHDNRADFSKAEEKICDYGEDAIGLKVYFDINASDVRDIKPLVEICEYARKHDLLVMVHCSHSPSPMAQILDALSPGDILTHAFHGGENTAKADDFESMKAAKQRGVVIDAGFAGHIHTDFAVFREAVTQGVLPDIISTDITRASAYKRGGRYGLTTCMSMARTAGMDESDIFRAVTTTPAKVLGKEGQWGCLKEGGCADIAVLEYADEGFDFTDKAGNHFANHEGYRCLLTIADGDVVYRH